MLRTLYIVEATDKLNPEKTKTFYLTKKMFWQVQYRTYRFNLLSQQFNIYGLPSNISLSKIADVETFFDFKVSFN